MCGIFGFSGTRNAAKVVLEGLKRLEYRGYDSWGIVVRQKAEGSSLSVVKRVGQIGKVQKLDLPDSSVALGHTRWATHGGVTEKNAHPHLSSDGSFALAQNGIVENFQKLKDELLGNGWKFQTETDTEVIVRLIEQSRLDLQKTELDLEVLQKAIGQLKGRNTVALLTKSGEIFAYRYGSPLLAGRSDSGDLFISSDTLSLAGVIYQVLPIENGQLIHINKDELAVYELSSLQKQEVNFQKAEIKAQDRSKGEYEHYMKKEIMETPEVLQRVAETPVERLQEAAELMDAAQRVYTIGSGTAGVAAAQIAFYLREIAGVEAVSLVGAEALDYLGLFQKGDVLIVPSQSGETADVLEILELAKQKGVKIISHVNMPGSSMTRLSDLYFPAQAGPEICVMSTKVFVVQIAWGWLLAQQVRSQESAVNSTVISTRATRSKRRGEISFDNAKKDSSTSLGMTNVVDMASQAGERLRKLARELEAFLKNQKAQEQLQDLAKMLVKKNDIFLLGKYQNVQIIREGMIKLIEGSYKHAHAIPAGDLKHFAITLMEEGVVVLFVYSDDKSKSDVLSAASEVKARGATIIGFGPEENDIFDQNVVLPFADVETSAIGNAISLQLLAYYLAVELGHDVDHPRNIAKSVTVK